MPERPDLEYAIPLLDAALRGAEINGVRIKKPVVLRVAIEGQLEELLRGRRFTKVSRRAHFVLFEFAPPGQELELVVAPMLAGRFVVAAAKDKSPADLAVAWRLTDDRELRYRDDVQMGKVYLIRAGDWAKVPGLEAIGVDVLDGRRFTKSIFRALAKKRRDQLKVFLMDKSALDALGNAYADEVLFEARLHPKTFVKALTEDEIDRLHDAIVKVLSEARAEIQRRKPATDEKLRDFLKVRGRHGQPCPRCGAKIRSAGVHGHDAEFCPECQPATRKSGIVDWKVQ